jgi:hypothetical protein
VGADFELAIRLINLTLAYLILIARQGATEMSTL